MSACTLGQIYLLNFFISLYSLFSVRYELWQILYRDISIFKFERKSFLIVLWHDIPKTNLDWNFETVAYSFFRDVFWGNKQPFFTECSNHLKLCLPVEKKFIDKFVKDVYVDHATTEVKKGGGRKNVLGESKGYFMKRKNWFKSLLQIVHSCWSILKRKQIMETKLKQVIICFV